MKSTFGIAKMRFSIHMRNNIKNVQKLIKNDLGVVTEDKYVFSVRGGTGGNGLGRYNGFGGSGGSVYFTTKQGMAFAEIKKNLGTSGRLRAESGTSSQKTKLMGDTGQDMHFNVPVGIEVIDELRNILIARCNRPFTRYLIAKGGQGGSNTNSFRGEKGDELVVSVHLKLRPNVGFVGFPNAGKSTLLSAFVPKKSVRIAPYPFTTVNPQIAFWSEQSSNNDNPFTLSLADLPGIIEGASQNRGRGYQFLKHLENSEILCFVVDSLGFQLSNSLTEPFRNPLETVAILNRELESYDRRLVQKPAVLLLNKIDKHNDKEEIERLVSLLRSRSWEQQVPLELRPSSPIRFDYVLPVSARYGSIDEVKDVIIRLHKDLNPNSADSIDYSCPKKLL